jgi:phosphoribosylanthranilate isomerase
MTRSADVALAAELGATYVGAVFAGGPRVVTAQQAGRMFKGVANVRRVGVFGDQTRDEIARAAETASLDVIQLHADPSPEFTADVKRKTGLETWAAIRISNALDATNFNELASCADAILFDTRRSASLGGTGHTFDWSLVAGWRGRFANATARVVLAGGLAPTLVAAAIAQVRPDVVDVSSGIESAPGVKDPALMRAFVAAVRGIA